MAGEELIFSVDTVEAAKLGAYVISSNTTPAIAVATHAAASNPTVNAQDITITAKDVTKSIDVQDDWSAKTTATKISALAGSTGVTASAELTHIYIQHKVQTRLSQLKLTGRQLDPSQSLKMMCPRPFLR